MVQVLVFISIITQISNGDTTFFSLDSVYRRYEMVHPDSNTHDSLFKRTTYDTVSSGSEQLRITGSKDFLFDIDQGFNQGLNVDIIGEVEGVYIEGSLSDKNTAQSTVRLSEVEKISLQASTRYVSGGIGDLGLELPFRIQDEIQGVRFDVHSADKSHSLGAAYAINRGSTERIRFQGEEGKQSPYMLGGPVVPGSEHVYISHDIAPPHLVERDVDYTIDYEQGIVSFSNEQLITNRTRIEIEFSLLDEDYTTIYSAGNVLTNTDLFSVYGLVRRSSDDRADPLSFSLTQNEIDSLTIAGDSMIVAHTYADTSNEGDYIITDGHFVYAGAGMGTHLVTFFYKGENSGDYTYDPLIKAFAYVGPGNGNYSPTKPVPLPQRADFYGIGGELYKSLAIEVYGSSLDRNLFSPFNDDDNNGMGAKATFDHTFGIFSINGQYLTYNETFHRPHYADEIDLPYQWNTLDSLQEMIVGNLFIAPWSFLQSRFHYGVLNRDHYRKGVSLHPFFMSVGYEGVDTLHKYFAGFDHTFGKITFSSHYEYTPSSQYVDYAVGYMFTRMSSLMFNGSYDDDTMGTGITTIAKISTIPVTFSIGLRRYNDTTFIFGDAGMDYSYKSFSIFGTLQQSQRYLQKRDETYVRVDAGTGNYVFDPLTQTYVEREYGDYVRKVFLLDEFERVVSRKYNIEIRFTPSFIELDGRFQFIDEEEFLSINSALSCLLGHGDRSLECIASQDLIEDSRYTLYSTSSRTRDIHILSVLDRVYCNGLVKEHIDRLDDQIREQRRDYSGELAYRIYTHPLIKPLAGYTYSTLFSSFFSDMDIQLHTLKGRILCSIPISQGGRIEVIGELLYRLYNMEGIPYFFTVREPEGMTERIQVSSSIGIGQNTVFSLQYHIEFPPDDDFRQTLRLQTKIRF